MHRSREHVLGVHAAANGAQRQRKPRNIKGQRLSARSSP